MSKNQSHDVSFTPVANNARRKRFREPEFRETVAASQSQRGLKMTGCHPGGSFPMSRAKVGNITVASILVLSALQSCHAASSPASTAAYTPAQTASSQPEGSFSRNSQRRSSDGDVSFRKNRLGRDGGDASTQPSNSVREDVSGILGRAVSRLLILSLSQTLTNMSHSTFEFQLRQGM